MIRLTSALGRIIYWPLAANSGHLVVYSAIL